MIAVEHRPAGICIAVHGDLDEVNGPQLRTLLENARGSGADLTIDLTGCTFIHSAGMSLLGTVGREARLAVAQRGLVRKILVLCGFEHRFMLDAADAGCVGQR